MTPHAIWNFVEQSDFCWVMLFYTTENKTMMEFNQHERLKIEYKKIIPRFNPGYLSQIIALGRKYTKIHHFIGGSHIRLYTLVLIEPH